MNKKCILTIALLMTSLVASKKVYAFDSNNYKYRDLCGKYEVASFQPDGTIVAKSCHSSYEEARDSMKNTKDADLALLTKSAGQTKIIDANVALLDLTVNKETLTYFYTNSELKNSAYTYMDTGSLYGGVDGAHIESSFSNTYGVWTAKVKIGNFTGWIKEDTYEIVPITWVKSTSTYTVTEEDIRHNYVSKIQNTYSGSSGRTIGPKPEMLNKGTYYSYDGHYFYTNLEKMIRDYKAGNYNNAINKDNPYYNYYMYLSNHTKTAYSSINIDEYIRNNLGYKKNVYGNAASSGTSRLYGSGTFFYYAQEKYGVNAILSLSLSRNETGNGTSSLSINKNNGFGLNAVDSNPTQAANWYATFSSSILGYASKWITYGFAHPSDWRYFGPQFGDKWIGMNVKYASDTYWSEKMAANYYNLDKAFGLQDYNYYQLGVVNGPTNAYQSPSLSSRVIYTYPEKEDALVIVDEVTSNNEKWYKIVSDLNIDNNYNEIKSGDYNWNGYVYVRANDVLKINKSKNGYISPNSVFEYQNKDYEYDLYVENTELKPKVAVTIKNTPYYYDSSLSSPTGNTLLKDRYVMVYTVAYQNGMPVAYLVTSDYWYDQKEWISADSIKFVEASYGKVNVNVSGNQYTWVNYNTEDAKYSLISGLYTNSYVPILEQVTVGSTVWFKVPVSLTDNKNIYGYTLAQDGGVHITLFTPVVENTKPVIQAVDKTIYEKEDFDVRKDVTAKDAEDGDLTSKIEIVENTVNKNKVGSYKITYRVTDSKNATVEKTISVVVKENKAPEIYAKDITLEVGNSFNPLQDVTAKDEEDGVLTSKIKVIENTVNVNNSGTYKVVYEVIDSKNKKTTKEIKVIVKEKSIIKEETKEEKITYENIVEKDKEEGEFHLENLTWNKTKKSFEISGYLIILNQNNTSEKEYKLLLVEKTTKEVYAIKIKEWIEDTPYDLGSEATKTYTNSWFKDEIDFSNIPNGDYDIYMLAKTKEHSTIQRVTNYFNVNISRRGETSTHGYNFKVQQKSKQKEITLNIRDELYTTLESPTTRNMVNGYDEISFKNNKLYIYGYSYDYEGTYSNPLTITRKMIIENTSTYKQYYFDLKSTKGPFTIKTQDNKEKTYAWFEEEIDLSKLEKGTYSIYIYTKTVDATNYDELLDLFKMVDDTMSMNKNNYKLTYNPERNNRIEIVVK